MTDTKGFEQAGADWLANLLQLQGVNATVESHWVEDENGSSCWLTIDHSSLTPEQISVLVGERGQALDSVQYLANTILNLGKVGDVQHAYTIELDGYRARRLEELKVIAGQAAATVRDSGEEYEVCGLSSAERRQMHQFLSAYDGLKTFSRGREPDRRLVVCAVDSDPVASGSES